MVGALSSSSPNDLGSTESKMTVKMVAKAALLPSSNRGLPVASGRYRRSSHSQCVMVNKSNNYNNKQ